ncbi:hypothetical protein Btru_068600 [Bulinus truncatus]|nr:hypothetical protein Btru_068600 [Bulinus truncatus]
MQSWNPMKEAYEDPEFNRYPAGLGRDLSENVKNIDLYVENIPPTLGQEGLYNLFAEYGKVLKARIITSNKTNLPGLIGFVTMENMVDAEAAMSKIDHRKIGQRFILKVKLAYSKEERERRRKLKQNSEDFSNPSTDFDDTSSVISLSKPNYRVSDEEKVDWNQRSDNNTESLGVGRGRRHIQDKGPTDIKNDDYFEVSSFGRGRGIMHREKTNQKEMKGHLLNMKLNNDSSLTSVKTPFSLLEKLHNSLTEDTDHVKSGVRDRKVCNNCGKNGCSNLCSVCKQYYCSVECQRKDWPRHRNICGYLGTNISESNSMEGNFSDDGDKPATYKSDKTALKTKTNENYVGNSEKLTKKTMKDNYKTAHFDKTRKENQSEDRENEKSHYRKREDKNNLGKQKDFQTTSSSKEKTNNLSGFEKTDYSKEIKVALPVGIEVKAILTYFKSPSEFWISLYDQLMEFGDLTEVLNKELNNCTSTKLVKPRVGHIYGAKYEGEWCRVRIDDVADDEVTAYCIDYGNTEKIEISGLRQLTPEILDLPPQAIACCLSKLKPKNSALWGTLECDVLREWFGPPMSKFFMCKVVDTTGVLHNVKISLDEEDLSQKLIKNGLAEIAHVQPQPKLSQLVQDKKRFMVSEMKSENHLLKLGDRLKVVITEIESATKFNVIKIEAYKTLSQINALLSLEYNHKTPPYRPVKGELVVAQFPGDTSWYRCKVTEVKDDSYHVYCIDFGTQGLLKEDNVHHVKSSKLAEFPSLALRCSLFECDSFDGVSEDCMRKEFDTLFKDFADSKGVLSMVVKHKDMLVVDFLSESKELFSQALRKKLKQISLKSGSKQQKHSLKIVPSASSSSLKDAIKSEVPHLCDETLTLGDIARVDICFIVSAGHFYVHLVSKKNSFLTMMKEMNKSIQSAPVMSAPCVGSLVAVQYSLDDLWYRGKVKSIQGNECEVIFMDYANTERAQIDSLRELSSDFTQLPVQAIRCRLNIQSQPSKEADDGFKKFLENETVHIKAVKHTQEGYSVNIAVLDHIRLDFLKDMDINQPSVEQEIVSLDFAVNTVVKVHCVSMENPLRFYVQVTEHASSLMETTRRLNKRLTSQPETLRSVFVGCFAAAKSTFGEEDDWYRVKVESLSGDKCLVHFVDYGISEQILTSDLMMLRDEDYKLPACAIACRLKGCQMHYSSSNSSCLTMGQNLIESIKILGREEDCLIVDVLDCAGQCLTNKFVSDNSPQTFMKSHSSIPSQKYLTNLKQQKLPKTDQPIPAIVTHINSYHDLFVSLRDETAVSNFLKLMMKLNDKVETGKPLRNPVLGQVCASKFSQDDDWYRARIIEILEPSSVKVQFVDYGNCEEVILSDLRTLEDEFFAQPAQAIPCCIAGYESSENVTRNMKTNEKLKVNLPYNIKMIGKLDEKYVITVENEYGESVFEKLPASVHKLSAPHSSDLLMESPHEKEFSAIFCHINSLDDFYCQKIDEQALAELQSLSEDLKKDKSKLGKMKSVEPLVGCVYMSEFQGSWYRCVVQEIKGSKAVIKYIDYGNTEVKRADELYPLLPERMLMPVRLIKCKLHGVEPINSTVTGPDLKHYLEILSAQQPLLIIHKEVEDAFLVSMYIVQDDMKINVADDLVSNGLVKQTRVAEDVMESEACKTQVPLMKTNDTDEEDENVEELEIQIKILELQKKLAMTKQRKNKKN